jgi:hypothetical protein
MNSEVKPKEGEEVKPLWENDAFLKGLSVERFWLWSDVLKRVAEVNAEDAGTCYLLLRSSLVLK